MADLKQALIWLAEGKKIQNKEFLDKRTKYLEMCDGFIVDDDLAQAQQHLDANHCWELYEGPFKPKHYCDRGLMQCYHVDDELIFNMYGCMPFNVNFCPFCGVSEKDL